MTVYVQSWQDRADAQRARVLAKRVADDFHRLEKRITDVDVLIIDEGDAKECIMEAHLPNSEPIVVRSHGSTFERAVDKGADKIERVIESRIDDLEPINFPNN